MADAAATACPVCGTAVPVTARNSRGLKLLIAGLIAAVAVAVIVIVVVAVSLGNASNKFKAAVTPDPGRPPGYHGTAYPGMLTQDRVAGGAGSRLEREGEVVTAGNLTHSRGFVGPTLCVPVTIADNSAVTDDVGPYQWKLQDSRGNVESFTITGTLPFGQVAPGGTASGTVCFADAGQSGPLLLLWQPLFRVGRGVWMLPV